MGKDIINSPCYSVILDKNEFITCVAGTYSTAVDELIFYTNTGRIYHVGQNRQGAPFTLSHGKDNYVTHFSVGMKDYLTYLSMDFKVLLPDIIRNTAPFNHMDRYRNPGVYMNQPQNPTADARRNSVALGASATQRLGVSAITQGASVGAQRPNTTRASAPLVGPMFDPSINKDKDSEIDEESESFIEEAKYQSLENEEVRFIPKTNISFRIKKQMC